MSNSFSDRIKNFILFSKATNDNEKIKKKYFELVKIFHPDLNNEIDKEISNENMIVLNYVYEQLIKNKVNGKYCLTNEYGIKEYISDKALYIYKLGFIEFRKAITIMLENPGNKEGTSYEIIGHLYKSYKYFKEVIKLDKNGNWGRASIVQLHHAYSMNEHITRGLTGSDEKGLVEI
ncbi:DnaJ domain protein [Treponema primitia ZAS-2]|uniref:DnaJ domain protein n=1 Tax=Treponema primitia (strain ATCC BAA-887 / DSM 12427 / ZAS-2) TaxID=545694 RepID=F5YQE3_TREPZ|nr:J domain-containing protein [Treponema primitia]AEF84699.1 DnaJ domain protein [Treponema primitia ZAS-2]